MEASSQLDANYNRKEEENFLIASLDQWGATIIHARSGRGPETRGFPTRDQAPPPPRGRTSWSGGSAMGHASNGSLTLSSRAAFAGSEAFRKVT